MGPTPWACPRPARRSRGWRRAWRSPPSRSSPTARPAFRRRRWIMPRSSPSGGRPPTGWGDCSGRCWRASDLPRLALRRAGLGERADEVQDGAQLRQAHAVAVEELLNGKVVVQGVVVSDALGQVVDHLAVALLE